MAFKRKEYKDRVEDLAPQIIENIALIRHWSLELRGHLLTVSRFNLKGSNKWDASRTKTARHKRNSLALSVDMKTMPILMR